MGIFSNGNVTNGIPTAKPSTSLWDLDASQVKVTLTDAPKVIPPLESLKFGQVMTDHMIVATFHPQTGWSIPEIKPYGPICLDPASSCFHYSTSVFEGMKAYMGADGKTRLFRPELNMARIKRSVDRVALPAFNTGALITLIRRLVTIEERWIPKLSGYSLYIRPTVIGTRPGKLVFLTSLGVTASDQAMLYVICSPAGPYFRSGMRPTSLLAVGENVRAWPGGTGCYKLSLNYGSTMKPLKDAERQGYNQVLWLLGEQVTEAGAMNFFVVVKRDDDGWDVITPALDGTILPGVTRDSCLALMAAHPSRTILPQIPDGVCLHPQERTITMSDLVQWDTEGRLLEAFSVGTAAIVTAVGRIGYNGKDIRIPDYEGGPGPVAKALYERILEIQDGRVKWEGWSTICA
ncbi:uncharacterized protein FIBRA_06302 [Fibroporia radiculosa]|uniref:Branched-chain-amino-acid aminotransferase n=1 Tax=Fibroporia radiculosa TaxID=599839 RepID=J4GSH9_9APHY|nr:uncharacterized protein FIBRA_06302 [Fibroporia radiculosa]CCM04140.1 predicted protein [Fibroporia radiculosa]